MTTTAVLLRLEIFRGWIGEKEVPGDHANPVIAGTPTSWFSLVRHPEVTSDEVANCAGAVGASLVLETFGRAGYALADLDSTDPVTAATAEEALAEAIAHAPLPPLDTRLLARTYTNFGIDARANPQPDDIVVVPRGASWQGHVMLLDEMQSGLRRYKCVGANQRDMTSIAYVSFNAEIVGIRRPVAATTKDLLAAGSKAGVLRASASKPWAEPERMSVMRCRAISSVARTRSKKISGPLLSRSKGANAPNIDHSAVPLGHV
ncbi:hypothetical protein [Hyphomicrobium sp. LHD-15]|uniref:hypothetical protein n=1 Tax=Hyphomicrobium sp. LHD-15 TaxID=3072142 RepID=UPI00280DC195|nr:hypothetical protein [Hyphomicrobium sp. LHD-15]MDQ8700157.1 hypothetical protein [Hyphomicrobium sp. LHD-15]